ncbi:tetratricopeptide repeat protein [Streptacidiphilus jiangxiensis]|uniref:Tetratricopeptide repeat-containing protein n=1 Tax=Streptacidiphilus jiangxiensis TaxID=235985 RepID=A0A1H7JJI4_STRJI|nr:tetratricopeptide repeat protein [Streptacidiphilus jiangxiensis]SEK74110.1 Tetratricopeptide repeat-containing protein [Streptacidiphilus jiangxiensis]
MEELIALDEAGRMVTTDREALEREVAALLDGPADEPRGLRKAGVGLLVLGRREEALRVLTQALALADEKLSVAVHINLGDAWRYGGEFEAAEPHYQQALKLAEAVAPGMLYFCFQHLGKQRLDQGRTKEARSLLERALREQLAADDPSLTEATRTALRLVDETEAARAARVVEAAWSPES